MSSFSARANRKADDEVPGNVLSPSSERARSPRGLYHGGLAVHKPRGMISKDVSRFLQALIGRHHRMGHVGTLDPEAEGVLLLLLGRATRLQDHLLSLPKTYICDMQLGYETDTLDLDGRVVSREPWEHVEEDSLRHIMSDMQGKHLLQVPPLYSAVKFRGKALYSWAREGRENEIVWEGLGRTVWVDSLKFLSFKNGLLRFEVRCGKGTYIRVLARDIARSVASCGTVVRLVRTESSGLTLSQAHSPEEISDYIREHGFLAAPLLISPETLCSGSCGSGPGVIH